MSEIAIRRGTAADAEPVARLVTELGYATSARQMDARLEAIERDDDYETLVACDGGTVVGFIETNGYSFTGRRYMKRLSSVS